MNKRLIIYTVLWFGALHMTAHAATVVWPAVSFAGTGDNIYWISTDIVEPVAGGVAMSFEANSTPLKMTLTAWAVSLACGNFWFETAVGAPIDSQAASLATPFVHNFGESYGEWTPVNLALNQIFYLGFWLDADGSRTPSVPTDVYGWVALRWDGVALTLVGSAAETTGVGIYAGTYDAIPEPSAASLLLVGIAAALLRRRRPRPWIVRAA